MPPPAAPFQLSPSIFDSFQPQSPTTDNNYQPPPSIFNSFQPPTPRTDKNFGNFHVSTPLSSFNKPSAKGPSNNLFGSQAATLTREKEQEKVVQDSVQKELDDTIYKLLNLPTLELDDGLLDALGVEANDVLDSQFITKKEKEDLPLKNLKKSTTFMLLKMLLIRGMFHSQLNFSMVETMRTLSRQLNFSPIALIT